MQHADAGEDSVGIEVSVKHLAATLPGMTVEIAVRVAAVEGRKVMFEVSAKDELEAISAARMRASSSTPPRPSSGSRPRRRAGMR